MRSFPRRKMQFYWWYKWNHHDSLFNHTYILDFTAFDFFFVWIYFWLWRWCAGFHIFVVFGIRRRFLCGYCSRRWKAPLSIVMLFQLLLLYIFWECRLKRQQPSRLLRHEKRVFVRGGAWPVNCSVANVRRSAWNRGSRVVIARISLQ